MGTTTRLAAGFAFVGIALFGCAADGEGEASRRTADALFVASQTIWPLQGSEHVIDVCWEQDGYTAQKAMVRDAVESSWAAHSAVRFLGWNRCGRFSAGIHVRWSDERPHVKKLGRGLDRLTGGMVLNSTFRAWAPTCQPIREECIRTIAVHEFGHALGFSHEQNRADTPASCTEEKNGTYGDRLVGPWDLSSTMNYCNPNWGNGGKLSPTDIQGVQLFYGKRNAPEPCGPGGCEPPPDEEEVVCPAPEPHYKVVAGKCLPSCGAAGGLACDDPIACDGKPNIESYDCGTCCVP